MSRALVMCDMTPFAASVAAIMAARSEVGGCRIFFHKVLGMRVTAQIVFDGNQDMGAWLSTTNKSYYLAFLKDKSSSIGSLHKFCIHRLIY